MKVDFVNKNDKMLSMEDIVNYFSEDASVERKAKKILEHLVREQNKACVHGERVPIFTVTEQNTTPEEREMIARHFEHQRKKINNPPKIKSTEPFPPQTVPNAFPLVPLVRSIQNLIHPQKENGEVSIYDLMSSVLEQAQVVNYEGCIY